MLDLWKDLLEGGERWLERGMRGAEVDCVGGRHRRYRQGVTVTVAGLCKMDVELKRGNGLSSR